MSDLSLTFVLQFKTSKIINDVAKVQQKSEKITAFRGIIHAKSFFCKNHKRFSMSLSTLRTV